MIEAAYIIALAMIFSSLTKFWYSRRPRIALATVSVGGITDSDGEQIQGTVTIFPDETAEERQAKLHVIWELREYRLKMQNERMMAIQEEARRLNEEQKKKPQVVK